MVSVTITHIIGTVALIIVLTGIISYTYINVSIMTNSNFKHILKTIAEDYALTIRSLYYSGFNGTIYKMNNPVEIASRTYYNIYIGYGAQLAGKFPDIRKDPDYSPYAIYVVASIPGRNIYSYALALPPKSDGSPRALIGKGRLIQETGLTGFLPGQGYVENGLEWTCRMPITVTERSGSSLENYPVRIILDINNMYCNYQGTIYKPTLNDLRFTDSDGRTRLDYWIEYWDNNRGVAIAWVKIPSLTANSSKIIYAYWGQPEASYEGTTAIFPLYEDLSQYTSIDQLLNNGNWHLYDLHATYSSSPYTLTYDDVEYNGLELIIDLQSRYNNAYLNIYTTKTYNITPGEHGWIAEALTAPLTPIPINTHVVRLSWYNSTSSGAGFTYLLEPGLYQEYDQNTSLSDYTVVWGDWDIATIGNGNSSTTVLRGNNTDLVVGWPPYNYYNAAAIMRQNAQYDSRPGREGISVIVKVYVKPDDVIRGIVFADNPYIDSYSTSSIGFGVYEDTYGRIYLVKTYFPDLSSQVLKRNRDYQGIGYEGWLYIKVTAKTPGRSNARWRIEVYDEYGNKLLSKTLRGTQVGRFEPDYIGYYAYTDYGYITSSYFQDLVSARYDRRELRNLIGTTYLDPGIIYVKGLSPGWNITIYDSGTGEYYSAIAQSNGIAYIDVTTSPIIGTKGPLYIEVRDRYGNLVYYFKVNYPIPGGSILTINVEPWSPDISVMTSLDAVSDTNGLTWDAVYNPDASQLQETPLTAAYPDTPVILGVGLYGDKSYYVIYNTTYSRIASGEVEFPSTGSYYASFGAAKLNNENEETAYTFYSWIRIRPFVYPEPSVEPQYSAIEHLATPSVPVIEYTTGNYIVFSSTLLVDLALVVTQDNQYVIVALIGGERYP